MEHEILLLLRERISTKEKQSHILKPFRNAKRSDFEQIINLNTWKNKYYHLMKPDVRIKMTDWADEIFAWWNSLITMTPAFCVWTNDICF